MVRVIQSRKMGGALKKRKPQTIDEKHEAKLRRLAKTLRDDPEWKNVHRILDAKDNKVLSVMNEVLSKQARRKIN